MLDENARILNQKKYRRTFWVLGIHHKQLISCLHVNRYLAPPPLTWSACTFSIFSCTAESCDSAPDSSVSVSAEERAASALDNIDFKIGLPHLFQTKLIYDRLFRSKDHNLDNLNDLNITLHTSRAILWSWRGRAGTRRGPRSSCAGGGAGGPAGPLPRTFPRTCNECLTVGMK